MADAEVVQPAVATRDATVRRWLLFAAVALAVIALDQLTKAWVVANFQPAWTSVPVPGLDPPTPILGDFVRIAIIHNDGGIFGLFGASAPILAVASIAVIALIVAYASRVARSGPTLLMLCLGLLLGGALGNFIDRLRFGYVIDFVDTGIGQTRWYTFNVADAALSIAIVGLVAIALFGDRFERTA